MNEVKFFLDDLAKHCKMSRWLRIKFYWYKYVKRLDIIGFYSGIPIIRTKYLEPDPEEDYDIGADKE